MVRLIYTHHNAWNFWVLLYIGGSVMQPWGSKKKSSQAVITPTHEAKDYPDLDPDSGKRKDINFYCPSCHESLVIDASAAGYDASCPLCEKPIRVPMTSTPIPPLLSLPSGGFLRVPRNQTELREIESANRFTDNTIKELQGNVSRKEEQLDTEIRDEPRATQEDNEELRNIIADLKIKLSREEDRSAHISSDEVRDLELANRELKESLSDLQARLSSTKEPASRHDPNGLKNVETENQLLKSQVKELEARMANAEERTKDLLAFEAKNAAMQQELKSLSQLEEIFKEAEAENQELKEQVSRLTESYKQSMLDLKKTNAQVGHLKSARSALPESARRNQQATSSTSARLPSGKLRLIFFISAWVFLVVGSILLLVPGVAFFVYLPFIGISIAIGGWLLNPGRIYAASLLLIASVLIPALIHYNKTPLQLGFFLKVKPLLSDKGETSQSPITLRSTPSKSKILSLGSFITMDHLRISLVRIKVGPLSPVADGKGEQEAHLILGLVLENTSLSQPIALKDTWGKARLVKIAGQKTQTPFDTALQDKLPGAGKIKTLKPGQFVEDRIVFRAPDGQASDFTVLVDPGIYLLDTKGDITPVSDQMLQIVFKQDQIKAESRNRVTMGW